MHKLFIAIAVVLALVLPSTGNAAKLPSSEFSYSTVKVSQKVGKMKVTKVDKNPELGLGDVVYFSGTMTLSGDFEYSKEDGIGCPLTITLDKASLRVLPHVRGELNNYFKLDDCERGLGKLKRGTRGKITFTINKLLVSPPAGEIGGSVATIVKIMLGLD